MGPCVPWSPWAHGAHAPHGLHRPIMDPWAGFCIQARDVHLASFWGDKWGCALAGLFHVDGLGMEKCPVVLLKVLFDLKSGFLSKL